MIIAAGRRVLRFAGADVPSRLCRVVVGRGIAVDAARQQRWLDIVGADHWSVTVSGWITLAINAQLLGSGLQAEAAQWSWLAACRRACSTMASSILCPGGPPSVDRVAEELRHLLLSCS